MKKLPDMLVDLLKNDPLWYDLMDVVHNYTEEQVTKHIRVLDKIRVVTRDMDQDLVDESIRQLGFDIYKDLLDKNGHNIRKAYYQLSKYYQINGTSSYPNFIKFLLGRNFSVQDLYTSNYVDFFPQPQGNLITEGGQWFPTFHKNLFIDSRGLTDLFALNIGVGDISAIQKHYGYDSKTEAEKLVFDQWLSDNMRHTLVPGQDDPELIDLIVDLRISKVFYKFAPIQDVIKDIYIGLQTKAGLYASFHALENTRERYVVTPRTITNSWVNVRNVVSAGREYPAITITLEYSDNTSSTVQALNITDSKNYISSIDPLVFVDPDLMLSDDTVITCSALGSVYTKTVSVLQNGVSETPVAISVSGPISLLSEGRIALRLIGAYSGNIVSEVEDTDNVSWSVDSPLLSFEGATLIAQRVTDDFTATVTAVYNGQITAQHFVTVKNNLAIPVPVEIVVSYLEQTLDSEGVVINETPTTTFLQGKTYRIVTEIRYSDTTMLERQCNITSRVSSVPVENSVFRAEPVYADFNLSYDVAYNEDEEEVYLFQQIPIVYPAVQIASIEIMGPETVLEQSKAQFYVVATWENNQKGLLSDAYWRSTDRIDQGSLIRDVPVDGIGIVDTPTATVDYQANVTASILRPTDGATLTAFKVFTVQSAIRTVTALDIISVSSLREGNDLTMHTLAVWSTEAKTEVLPSLIEVFKDDVLYCRGTQLGTTIVYENFDTLTLMDHPFLTFIDGETKETHPVPTLLYPISEVKHSGLFTLRITYTDGISNIEQTKTLTLMPNLPKAVSLNIFAPTLMKENSRYFVSASSEFNDGSVRDVPAGWELTNEENSVDVNFCTITLGKFTVESIITALVGYDLNDLETMVADGDNLVEEEKNIILNGDPLFLLPENRPIAGQTWVEKLVEVIGRYDQQMFPRAVLDIGYVLEPDTILNMSAMYHANTDVAQATVMQGPELPTTLIESWYIWGPVEIFGNRALTYSYALFVKYELCSEYAVSNDWSIDFYSTDTFDQQKEILRYLVDVEGKIELMPLDDLGNRLTVGDLTDEQLDEILPIEAVVDIDQNGYVYPMMNVEGSFVITADYDDGRSTFSETLLVRMSRINTRLEGLDMYLTDPSGVNKTTSFGSLITDDSSLWSTSLPDGTLVYQLGVDLRRAGSIVPETPPGVVIWRASSISGGVAFDESTGRLYVVPQTNDQEATFTATYEEEFRETDTSTQVFTEKVTSVYTVLIYAHRALDFIELNGNDYTIDDRIFYPEFEVTRRDGAIVNQNIITLGIVSGPDGLEVVAGNGIRVPKLNADNNMVVRALATEGTRQIFRDFTFNLLASFIPETLDLTTNPVGIRDNSVFNVIAMLHVRNSSIPVDVSRTSYWRLDTIVPGLEIDNRTGVLTIPSLTEDLDIVIRCAYNDPNLTEREKVVVIRAHTSFPRYWTAGANAINSAYFQLILDQDLDVLHSTNTGGTFVTNLSSQDYLYYAYPKTLGAAQFSLIPRQYAHVEWDNMMAAVEVVRTYPDGSTEVWNIHRSVDRGLGTLEFGVLYNR